MSYAESADSSDNLSGMLQHMANHGSAPVYAVVCVGHPCEDCRTDKDLYRVCPGCKGELPEFGGIVQCNCGTAMYVCGGHDRLVVTAYALPNPLFEVGKEDVI